jgi:hypothetical protein
MIGLIVLAIAVPALLAYLWLARAAVRYAKRKTGSNLIAALAVIGVLIVTFGDTVFNRWYHKEVLCKRNEVGGQVFEKVILSAEHWDEANNRPNLPLTMSREQPFLGRYAEIGKHERGGSYPFTAYEKDETVVIDIQTGHVLSRFVDYSPAGGTWWAMPLTLFGQSSVIGWLLSRGTAPGCDGLPMYGKVDIQEGLFDKVDVRRSVFEKHSTGEIK